ncbi:MAG: glucose 1-dehydrogenase [Hyphomicrobiales bacterium]|nr:glucose 1-dehydrogenase [Hyphomicrobiales bacterium]
MKRLADKKVLVTGGSRGIGAAIAKEMASEGADVAFTWFSSAEAAEATAASIRRNGARACAIHADSGDGDAVRAATTSAHEQLGGLDILVNNAGIFERRLLQDTSDDEFDRIMAVNLRGAYIAIKTATQLMPKGGRIINMSSTFGARVPSQGIGLYATSKFALAGMTRAFARDLAPLEITVNAIQPGAIATDMNPATGSHARLMTMMTAVGRYGEPEDIAKAAIFLAGDESRYITGATINVDGGFES